MHCVRCDKKLKLRNDGWRRCGNGCSEVMGVELRAAMMPQQEPIEAINQKTSTFKARLKPTWKSENAA